jgi:diguanylate cyclase (GGDEF)-like protein
VVGRIGGEEFSIFLPDTDSNGAAAVAEKIRQDIEQLMPSIGDIKIKVTASIGVAQSLPSHGCISDIQKEADQAMYLAKAQGRNRVTCFA